MSLTVMIEAQCSGIDLDNQRWALTIMRPVMTPALPPVGSVIVLKLEIDDPVSPDESTIKRIVFVEGEEFFRCQIQDMSPDGKIDGLSFLNMAEKYGWKRDV